jgi:hypothetical protein
MCRQRGVERIEAGSAGEDAIGFATFAAKPAAVGRSVYAIKVHFHSRLQL